MLTRESDISECCRHVACFAREQTHSNDYATSLGELDALMSATPHCHFVTGPVFGAPAQADKAALIVLLSGDYRSKKEVAYILVPAIGRRVLDLGGNVEKGDIASLFRPQGRC